MHYAKLMAQNCGNKMKTNFPLDNVLISDNDEKYCDCQHILHSNVEELLSWARHMRGMTTGLKVSIGK